MLSHLIRSKGPLDIFRRGWSISTRVGLGPGPMRDSLRKFAGLAERHGAPVTLPVPAVVLQRHAGLLRALAAGGQVELAVHGNRHVDHSLLQEQALSAELAAARAAFSIAGVAPTGFRAPYLRWNDPLLRSLAGAGFSWDSSQCVLWPVVDEAQLAPQQQNALRMLLEFDRPRPAHEAPALPFWVGEMVEIPVSFPDDEMLVERLRLGAPEVIAAHWIAAFEQTHARGQAFVLQLHPERFPLCRAALALFLEHVDGRGKAVWRASLGEMARWWREKEAVQVTVTPADPGAWEAVLDGPAQAVFASAGAGDGRRVRVQAERRPVVGAPPGVAPGALRYLTGAGYVVEPWNPDLPAAVRLKAVDLRPETAAPLLAELDDRREPLLRVGRWPAGARSALALSGDLDAVTLWDYGLRLAGR